MPVWSQFALEVAESAQDDPQKENAESRFYPAYTEMLQEAFARHDIGEPLRIMRYKYTPKYAGAGEREVSDSYARDLSSTKTHLSTQDRCGHCGVPFCTRSLGADPDHGGQTS